MRNRCPYYTDGIHRFGHHVPENTCQCGDLKPGEQLRLDATPARPPIDRPDAPVSEHHPHTSHEAAARARPRSTTRKAAVLAALVAAGDRGATDEELQEATGIPLQSEIPARNSLVKDGWARDSGDRRPTRTGNPAIVWTYEQEPPT